MSSNSDKLRRQRYADHQSRLNQTTRPPLDEEAFARHAEAVSPRVSRQYETLRRIEAGIAADPHAGLDPAQRKAQRRQEELAKSFRYDARQEELLKLKDAHDPRFDSFPPESRISLGFYERSKAAAKAAGLSTGKPRDDD